MLQKGALEPVDQPGPGFYSWLFLVEKVTGGWWPAIDLSTLNDFVTVTKFQVETVASEVGSIRKGDWMFLIDLKDAHLQIPVHPESWPFLCFCLGGQVFQLRALCFGLSTAPQVFTRVFALVPEWSHRRGVCLLRYLDVWLVIAESRYLLLHHLELVLQLCVDLGIVVNWERSDLQPSTRVQYLGMLIDMSLQRVFPLLGSGDVLPSASVAPITAVAAGVGPHGVAGALSSQGLNSHESPPVAPQGPLVSHGRRPGRPDPSIAGVRWGSALVAPGGQVVVRGSSSGPFPISVVVYWCISVWGFGSAPVGSDGLRCLVRGRKHGAHQCAWD